MTKDLIIKYFLISILASTLVFGALQALSEYRNGVFATLAEIRAENERLLQRFVAIESEIRQIQTNENEAPLWSAEQVSDVNARAQAVISSAAMSSGATIRSVTPVEGSDFPLVVATSLRVEVEGHYDDVLRFLDVLQSNEEPFLFDRVNLRRLNRPTAIEPQPLMELRLAVTTPTNIRRENDE